MGYTKRKKNVKNKTQKNKTQKNKSSEKIIIENNKERKKQMEMNKKTFLELENETSKTLKSLFSPKSIKPQNDFYTYINYQWIKDVEKKKLLKSKYFTQYDNFRLVQEKVYYDLVDITNDYIKNNKTKLAKEFGNVYLSHIDGDDDKVDEHVVNSINIIDEFILNDDLYGLLAYINNNDLSNVICPIRWDMNSNVYEPTKYINYLVMPQLPFYDFDLYFDNDNDNIGRKQYKTFFRNRYDDYVVELFNYIEKISKNKTKIKEKLTSIKLFTIGQKIAQTTMDSYYEDKISKPNILVNKTDMLKLYGFDWDKFAKCMGYKTTPNEVILVNASYIKLTMENLNTEWKNWREWWIYSYAKQQIRFSRRLYPIYFKFYRKYVQGAEFKVPQTITPIFLLSLCFDTLLSNEYVKKYAVKEEIEYTENLANELKETFITMLQNNTWMSPKTKKYAILKLNKLKIIIGYPTKLREDPLLGYSRTDVLENLEKIYKWRLEKYILLSGKDIINIPSVDWTELKLNGRQCYIVNAFYTPSRNDIYIPLGYLQKPFLDFSYKGIEYNLAFMGFTIAHELSHSLDNSGRKYSYDGKPLDWWSPNDEKIYQKKIESVKTQYEKAALNDGIVFNADSSIGESIADISGLAICEHYLIHYYFKNEYIVPIQILSLKEFFTYYAIQMRQSIAKKAYRVQTVTNPHPFDKYRVNIPLSRLKLFKDAYDIKKGNKMYFEFNDTIWS